MIEVRWLDERRQALLWVFPVRFALEDYYAAVEETARLTRHVTSFDIVADVTQTLAPPQNFVSTIQNIHRHTSPRYDMTIVFGANPLVATLLEAVTQAGALRGRYLFVKTLEEALLIVEARHNARTV